MIKKSKSKLSAIGNLFRRRKKVPQNRVISVDSEGFHSSIFPRHGEHTLNNMKNWERMYSGDGLIFSAVNSISQSVIGSGWEIVSIDKDAQEIVENFVEKIDLDKLIFNIVCHLIVFGDAYIEKEYSSLTQDLIALSLCDPKTIEVITDKYGNEIHYIQKIEGNYTGEVIEKKDLVHQRLYSIPSSPYGISTIGANYDTIRRKIEMDAAIAASLLRHGFPKYHISVGGQEEGELPPKEVITKIKDEFKEISEKNEFVTADIIKINGIDVRGIEHIKEYYDYYLALVLGGFMVPGEQLGLFTGSTEASGKVRERLFNRFIKGVQHQVVRSFDLEIFPDILKDSFPEAKVRLRFEDISPIEESIKIKWVEPLLRTSDGPFEILTKNEIRKIFGYEPLDK